MSSLTDEQRRRIEENRRKALERRAAAGNNATVTQPRQFSTNNQNFQKGVNNGGGVSSSNLQKTAGSFYTMPTAHEGNSVSTGLKSHGNEAKVLRPSEPFLRAPSAPPSSIYPANTVAPKSNTVAAPFIGKTVSGTCIMVARDRFMVEIGFQQQLLTIFRTIPGHKYDGETKRWTFPLSQYSELMTAVASLKSVVNISPLPNFVLRIFRKPRAYKNVTDTDLSLIDRKLMEALMNFQVEGVKFGISRGGRCLISDDMGLGKSIQALGIAHFYFDEWPLLIVCPSSMRYAWRDSIRNWLPSVLQTSTCVIETGKDDIEGAKILISSYDLLSKRSKDFMKCGVVIMDESHNLKNFKTNRTKAAIPIMENARRLILLSGTPALSRPIELFTQIAGVDRSLFPTINEFGVRYCNGKKNAWGWDYNGSSNMEELQLVLESTIMIRRLKSDVLKQLPPKMRKVMVLDPQLVRTKNKSLKATAAAFIKGKSMTAMERRGKLLEYYAETANAKLEAVTMYLQDLIEDGKKFICFAHHKTMMDGICAMLEKTRTRYIRIDGATAAADRKASVDVFQTHDNVPVAILSITAANTGITLTAAKMVVFAELYWNPGVLTQAEDRAHRIGQEDSVFVEYLMAGGTADDVLWPMVQEKLKVLNRVGLSKDDFSSTDATSLAQRNSGSPLDAYLLQSSQDATDAQRECDELASDKVLLDQLLDESFN